MLAAVETVAIASGVAGAVPVGSGARARSRAGTIRPDRRAGHRVVLHTTPDAEIERRVILLVATGELDSTGRRSIATASDLHLGTSGRCYYLIREGQKMKEKKKKTYS